MISFGHMRHVHYCLKAPSFLLFSGPACGLQITSTGPTSIEKASGETVKLDCQFTLAAEDSGPLDIEWSLQPSDNQKEEKVVSRQCDCVSGYEIWLVSVWETVYLCAWGKHIWCLHYSKASGRFSLTLSLVLHCLSSCHKFLFSAKTQTLRTSLTAFVVRSSTVTFLLHSHQQPQLYTAF